MHSSNSSECSAWCHLLRQPPQSKIHNCRFSYTNQANPPLSVRQKHYTRFLSPRNERNDFKNLNFKFQIWISVEKFQIQIRISLFQMFDSRICWHIASIFGNFQKHISYFGAYSREHIRTFSEHLQPVLIPGSLETKFF